MVGQKDDHAKKTAIKMTREMRSSGRCPLAFLIDWEAFYGQSNPLPIEAQV